MKKRLGILLIALSVALVSRWGITRPQTTNLKDASPTMHLSGSLATFAAGCFWCIEPAFQETTGVLDAVVGYSEGDATDATYDIVSTGKTKHKEAIQVTYDPAKISYAQLLDIFRAHIDPTDPNGQFVDQGPQYRTAIYYHTDEQQQIAEASKAMLDRSGMYSGPIVTEIMKFTTFFPAEAYHQDFYKHSAERYSIYKKGSGREEYFDEMTKKKPTGSYVKPSEEELRAKLTAEQYGVTQTCNTEPPFQNAYRDNERAGIYVDVVSGQPLFSSLDKFDSGTGRPSFTKPIASGVINESVDSSDGMVRTEIKSSQAGSHLGHVFDDGPADKGGLRYCTNSASLRFIPVEDLEKEGYGARTYLFAGQK